VSAFSSAIHCRYDIYHYFFVVFGQIFMKMMNDDGSIVNKEKNAAQELTLT